MTLARTLTIYFGTGATIAIILTLFDGRRGFCGGVAAWSVCLVPLVRWPFRRRVAVSAAGPRIAGTLELIQARMMVFRLIWVLGVGAVLYQYLDDSLGIGFWIALVVLYQVMLWLSVVGVLGRDRRTRC